MQEGKEIEERQVEQEEMLICRCGEEFFSAHMEAFLCGKCRKEAFSQKAKKLKGYLNDFKYKKQQANKVYKK